MIPIQFIQPGMKVRIGKECPRTKHFHGFVYERKRNMCGTIQTVSRIRNETTIVIEKWHFHPDDLYQIDEAFDESKPIVKPEYKPVYFNVEGIE